MPKLPNTLNAWESDAFEASLKRELKGLAPGVLPLVAGGSLGGFVDYGGIEISVLGSGEDADAITVRVGVFFSETLVGCSCGDEPSPQTAYCELSVRIDKVSGEAQISLRD